MLNTGSTQEDVSQKAKVPVEVANEEVREAQAGKLGSLLHRSISPLQRSARRQLLRTRPKPLMRSCQYTGRSDWHYNISLAQSAYS